MEEYKQQVIEINILGVEMDTSTRKMFCRIDAKYSCEDAFASAAILAFFKKHPKTIPFFKEAIDILENQPQMAELLKEAKD